MQPVYARTRVCVRVPSRKLREFFEIDAGNYMLSLCGGSALRLLNRRVRAASVPQTLHAL